MDFVVMAFIVMAYMVVACMGMAYIGMACILMVPCRYALRLITQNPTPLGSEP